MSDKPKKPPGKKKRTPYEVLGIKPDASEEQIKAAHRRRVRETHTDRGGDREEFDEVQTAIAIIGDPARRAHYDATGTETPADGPVNVFAPILTGAYMSIVTAAINQDKDLGQLDIVKGMQEHVRQTLAAARENLAKAKRIIKKLKRAEGRLREPESIFAHCLRAEIGRITIDVDGLTEQMPQVEEALAYLQKCKYDVERDPWADGIHPMRGIFFGGSATSGS